MKLIILLFVCLTLFDYFLQPVNGFGANPVFQVEESSEEDNQQKIQKGDSDQTDYIRRTTTRRTIYAQNQRHTIGTTRFPPRGTTQNTPRPRRSQNLDRNQLKPGDFFTETKNGLVRGKLLKLEPGKDVIEFLGIPFAQPPVGNLRFKKPLPVESWDGIWEATKAPNACYQNTIEFFPNFKGENVWNPNTNVSEDCLYLNIWIPKKIFQNKEKELYPVMFWIYGGGYFSGSSALDVYNGAILSAEEDVIVVSTNYRLGPLGFLYFGVEEAPGNMGLFDQNMALKWTYENIQYFGGNKDSITLFGESCGAASVTYHLISPLSRGFFKRGIILSGTALAPYANNSPERSKEIAYNIATDMGCDINQEVDDIIECLREIDSKRLWEAQWKYSKSILDFPMVPTVDGQFISDYPENLIGIDGKRADLIISSLTDEGSYFLLYNYLDYLSHLNPTSIPYDRFKDMMNEIFISRPQFEREVITQMYTNWENPEDGFVNQQKLSDAISDAFFICPMRELADLWSNRGLDVYHMWFTRRTESNPWPRWMGVMHGDEIEYVFGQPLADNRFTYGEKLLSQRIMNLFANFAKVGVPSNNWEKYTKERPVILNLNATRVSDKTFGTLGPKANNCAFWNDFLPKLRLRIDELGETSNDFRQFGQFRKKPRKSSVRQKQGPGKYPDCPTPTD